MVLYFVRHGQTQNNLDGKMNPGDDDDTLTEIWKSQAKKAGEKLATSQIQIDIIVSSPLSRAMETAQIIAQEIEYTWEIFSDARLREQDAWVFLGKKRDDIKQEFWISTDDEFRRIFKDKTYNQKEDLSEFDARVSAAYQEITKNFQGKNILFVAHSGTSRALLRAVQWLDYEYVFFQMPGVKNCEIINLETY